MHRTIVFAVTLLAASEALAAPQHFTIHNPGGKARAAAVLELPAALAPGDWVAVAGGEVAPVQSCEGKTETVLDLPASAKIALDLRPRLASDPPPADIARAVIPVKTASGYRDMAQVVVPSWHKIHDPLYPIEGAGWESGRIGYRLYLDERNAVDIYGKKQPAPILDKIGHPGERSYHLDAPWGMDIWKVGDSLGAGGLGVLRGKMAEQIGPMQRMAASVREAGPVCGVLHVDTDGFMVDGKRADLAADYSITTGTRLFEVSAAASPGVPLVAGFGKYPDTTILHSAGASGWGTIASWGRQSEDGKDVDGAALFYPLASIARAGDDGRSFYIVFKDPAHAHYAFAGVWARDGQGIDTLAKFSAFVARTAFELSHPVTVTAR